MVTVNINKRIFHSLTFFLIFSILAGSAVLLPQKASATVIPPHVDECFPAVLMLKGSGEDDAFATSYLDENNQVLFNTNGAEGLTLQKLLIPFAKQTNPVETTSKVRFVGIDYPAAPVFPDAGLNISGWVEHYLFKYRASIEEGAKNVVDFINLDATRGCNTQYMIVGYSQGALSLRLALGLLDNDSSKVLSTYVIGDPAQKPNGAISPSQITEANTATGGVGMTRAIAEVATYVDPFTNSSIVSSLAKLKAADEIVYRDGIVSSRSLCHNLDPTCTPSFLGVNPSEHTNYFEPSTISGSNDLEYEISEFDKQVKTLANSTTSNPRDRKLMASHSTRSEMTTYNIVGGRGGDKCWWDENSDGIYEASNIDCTTYSFLATSDITELYQKMTVKVVDKYGTETHLTRQDSIFTKVNEQDFNNLKALNPNNWYQFHPYSDPQSCVSFVQDSNTRIQTSTWDPNYAQVSACSTTTPNGFNEIVETSKQVFKPIVSTSHTGERKMLWGYDDSYNWYMNYDNSAKVSLMKNDWAASFTPELIKVENGIGYYRIKFGSYCVYLTPENKLSYQTGCGFEGADTSSLFTTTVVNNEHFGSLSIEKDTDAPTNVTNVQWSNITSTSATLTWDPAVDIRDGLEYNHVSYQIYRPDFPMDDLAAFTTDSNSYEIDYATYGMFPGQTLIIRTVDMTHQNASSGVSTYFKAPNIQAQPKPTLGWIANDYLSLSLSLPYDLEDTSISPEYIKIYRNGVLYDTTNGSTYVDANVSLNENYSYAYQLVRSNGQASDISEPLNITLTDTVAPSRPSNLNAPMSVNEGDSVTLTWSSSTDNLTPAWELKYRVYRNGFEITTNPISLNTFTDTNSSTGTNSYYVVAVDAAGNVSLPSYTTHVQVNENTNIPNDIIAPIITLIQATGTTVTLNVSSETPDVYYDLYRDGVFYAYVYGNVFSDWGVNPNSTYEYTAKTHDSNNNVSDFSEPLLVSTPAPEAIIISNTEILYSASNVTYMRWDVNNSNSITSYKIFRDDILIAETYDKYYIDTTVSPNTTYNYKIVANDMWGQSSTSEELIITTASSSTEDILAPSSFDFKAGYSYGGSGYSHLEWIRSVDDSGTVNYNVYRNGVLITTTNELFYEDSSLNTGVYTYVIVASDPTGNVTSSSSSYTTWVF